MYNDVYYRIIFNDKKILSNLKYLIMRKWLNYGISYEGILRSY